MDIVPSCTTSIEPLTGEHEQPTRDELELAAVLHALSDPQRLRIVRELAADPTPRACRSFGLEVTKSTCTHHFRVLREAGLISQRVHGTSRLNTLRRDDLDARFPGLLDAVLAAGAVPAGGLAASPA
jgi:DNA-binding transcriptional ArsR family regulator